MGKNTHLYLKRSLVLEGMVYDVMSFLHADTRDKEHTATNRCSRDGSSIHLSINPSFCICLVILVVVVGGLASLPKPQHYVTVTNSTVSAVMCFIILLIMFNDHLVEAWLRDKVLDQQVENDWLDGSCLYLPLRTLKCPPCLLYNSYNYSSLWETRKDKLT